MDSKSCLVHVLVKKMQLNHILWNPDGNLMDLGFFALKYYSLCFLLAFTTSYFVIKYRFNKTGYTIELLDKLTIYVFFGTLIGARLVHCLFYDFAYYSQHLLEIFLPFTFYPDFRFTGFAGLASHGGGAGIIISLILFSQKYKIELWKLLDEIALVVPLAGFFIRIGNLMNSEIIGKPSNLPWAFVFIKEDNIPRHPAQLYETIFYLFIFVILFYAMNRFLKKPGYYFGLSILMIFIVRFMAEFIKEDQSAFEAGMWLNMGQLLSIPFIISGIIIMFRRYDFTKSKPKYNH